jgi:hypothetical protein
MSLASDLEKLQRQRNEELRTLHQTYLRTKRTIVRTASPARIVRKHMGVSFALAAGLGMLLAPRPSIAPAAPTSPHAPRKHGGGGLLSHLGWLKTMVNKISPQAARYIPDPPPSESQSPVQDDAAASPPPPPKPRKGFLARLLPTLLKEVGAVALSKVDFHKLMEELSQRFTGNHPRDDQATWNPEPSVSVADVGTVKPTDYEHFE